MSPLALKLRDRYYQSAEHPYRAFERRADALIENGKTVLLDAGCGRTVPVLKKYLGRAARLIGVELVDFTDPDNGDASVHGAGHMTVRLREAQNLYLRVHYEFSHQLHIEMGEIEGPEFDKELIESLEKPPLTPNGGQ